MKINLSGKTALVCGSSAGIGQAIAKELANAGARIILLARNPEKLKQVADSLTPHPEGHAYYAADFSSNEDVAHAVQEIAKNHNIDILVNNTGGPPAGPAHLAQIDEYMNAFKSHLINNQILAQALIPGMKSRKWGRIINIISTSVKIPLHNLV